MNRPLLLLCLAVAACTPEAELTAASSTPLTDATYAGKTSNENLFAAVITTSAGVEAYLCDGTIDFWFRGEGSGDGVMEFGEDGAPRLLLQAADGRMYGRLIAVDGAETTFTLPAVEGEVLFRAEGNTGDERVLAGWIKLPSGEQRGAIRLGEATLSSQLDDGITPSCGGCLIAASLTPAPFTPATATKRMNVVPRVTILALGDSYMSGEGAPVTDGQFDSDGKNGAPATWTNGLPSSNSFSFAMDGGTAGRLAREARACHRGSAGLRLAVGDLRRAWPSVSFIDQSFACSGAQAKHLIDTNYAGPANCLSKTGQEKTDCLAISDDMPTASIRPQLVEAVGFLKENRLAADVVVMSVGGNDLGFGDVIADCLSSPGGGCEASDSRARQSLASGLAVLPGEYARLARALGDAGIPSSAVYIAQYPNPMRRTSSDLCSGLEFDDALMRFISDEESVFAGQVHTQMNAAVSSAATANRWNIVSSHVGTEVGHAMCNSTPWFNDTQTALETVGANLPPHAFGLVKISTGMVHPNRLGHSEGYKPAYVASLDAMLRRRFALRTPTNFQVTKMEVRDGRGVVTLQWDDVNTMENFHTLRDASGTRLAGTSSDETTTQVLLDGLTGSVSVEACLRTPDLCSARSSVLQLEVKRPTHTPTNVFASDTINASTAPSQIRLSWNDSAPTRMFTTVEMESRTGVLTRLAVKSQSHLLPGGTSLARFRVAACNTLGCGPASQWATYSPPTVNVMAQTCVDPRLNGCMR